MSSNPHNIFMSILALVFCALLSTAARGETISIYAAASLSTALQDLLPNEQFPDVQFSFAGSSTLAKQIEAGAPADLYFPANTLWMDYLAERNLIEPETRTDLLGNTLVLIAPKDEVFSIDFNKDHITEAFSGRLALGDPDHVPAGLYAKQALQSLGWWTSLQHRLAPAANVRAALNFVARGECPAGLVYATDAAISDQIHVVAALPDSLHTPIRYALAAVGGQATPAVRRLLEYLHSEKASATFTRHHFIVLHAQENAPHAQP